MLLFLSKFDKISLTIMTDKKFVGAPFGIQTRRFDVNGVHPGRIPTGSLTHSTYDRNSVLDESDQLGPCAYNVNDACSDGHGKKKVPGIDWTRQLQTERLSAQPHLLYKEQWEENKMLKRKLGPGSYEIKDFIQLGREKPTCGRGICDTLASRFDKTQEYFTAGPGTYGVGGIPQRAIEEKSKRSFSTRGMLELGASDRNITSVGSHLGPGTYNIKSGTQELLNKVTSLMGPYKLFSGDRNKPISEGYFAAPKPSRIGPGQYEIRSFVDNLHEPHRQLQGRFGKLAQYPDVPTDRIFLFSKTHHPNMKNSLGPGAYDVKEFSRPTAVNTPAFLSSSRRDDRMAQKFFTRNYNSVGPGRYDIQKFEEAQDVNGHTSVFKSKTGKLSLQEANILQERIRGRNMKNETFPLVQKKVARSITVM